MNNQAHIESFLDEQRPTLLIVDKILNEWNGIGCYKVPVLLMEVKDQMNWDDKTLNSKNPIIRDYLRNHPIWFITRGAKGGIMRRSDKDAKQQLIEAKKKAKEELIIQLQALEDAKKSKPIANIIDSVLDNE